VVVYGVRKNPEKSSCGDPPTAQKTPPDTHTKKEVKKRNVAAAEVSSD
jgi:hypothetical protein